jgi:hypothetical protein
MVLNAESLETVLLWTGNVDWPLPAVSRIGQDSTTGCDILTITPLGEVQVSYLSGNRGAREAVVLKVAKDYTRKTSIQRKEQWGTVKLFARFEGGYLVVQSGGLGFYNLGQDESFEFLLQHDVEVSEGILGTGVSEDAQTVVVRTGNGGVKIYGVRANKLVELAHLARPPNVAAIFDNSKTQGKVVVFHSTEQGTYKLPAKDISIAQFTANGFEGGVIRNVTWTDKGVHFPMNVDVILTRAVVLSKTIEGDEESSPSTSSAIFSNMLVIAHGAVLKLFSMSSFLLSYHEPTTTIELGSRVCFLKPIQIKYPHSSSRQCLIAGATSGEVFIIEAP